MNLCTPFRTVCRCGNHVLDVRTALELAEMTTLFGSRGEARRAIEQGGFSINGLKLSYPNELVFIGRRECSWATNV